MAIGGPSPFQEQRPSAAQTAAEGRVLKQPSKQERASPSQQLSFSWQTSQVPETLPTLAGTEIRGSRRGRGINEENKVGGKSERRCPSGDNLKQSQKITCFPSTHSLSSFRQGASLHAVQFLGMVALTQKTEKRSLT